MPPQVAKKRREPSTAAISDRTGALETVPLLNWLSENSGAIQAITAIAMAVIWVSYLQLIASGVRRQRRTEILILVGAGHGIEARCFVANLGLDPIYVTSVTVRLSYENTSETADITEVQGAGEEASAWERTLQGPMRSAESRPIGTLMELIGPALAEADLELDAIHHVHIRVSAFTASDSDLVAAERGFRLDRSTGAVNVRPLTLETRQIRWFLDRWRIRRQLRARL